MNKERILFSSKMLRAANELSATIHSDGAQSFVDAIFAEFKESKPKDVSGWLRSRLRDSFVYAEHPPKWLSEPEWPFAHGKPMAFICQYHIPMSNQLKGGFVSDLHLFVFAAKLPETVVAHDGWRTEYKVVEQSKD